MQAGTEIKKGRESEEMLRRLDEVSKRILNGITNLHTFRAHLLPPCPVEKNKSDVVDKSLDTNFSSILSAKLEILEDMAISLNELVDDINSF